LAESSSLQTVCIGRRYPFSRHKVIADTDERSTLDSSSSQRASRDGDRCGREYPSAMPRISAFYGIVIWTYHDEIHHRGRPHFQLARASTGAQ